MRPNRTLVVNLRLGAASKVGSGGQGASLSGKGGGHLTQGSQALGTRKEPTPAAGVSPPQVVAYGTAPSPAAAALLSSTSLGRHSRAATQMKADTSYASMGSDGDVLAASGEDFPLGSSASFDNAGSSIPTIGCPIGTALMHKKMHAQRMHQWLRSQKAAPLSISP